MQDNLHSSFVNGSDHKTVISENMGLRSPIGVAYLDGIVYVVERSPCIVKSFKLLNTSMIRNLTQLSNKTGAKLIVISESLQPIINTTESNQSQQTEIKGKISYLSYQILHCMYQQAW